MFQVFALLAEEHRQLSQLLDLLEQRAAQYLDGKSAPPPAWLMRDALEYMQQYPELFHHPLEDRLMVLLEPRVRDPELLAEMTRIQSQHQALEIKTAELVEHFEAICCDQIVPIRPLLMAFQAYARLQRSHLETEDRYLLPELAKLLSAEEDRTLMAAHKPIDDPLFMNATRGGFADLYQALLGAEAA